MSSFYSILAEGEGGAKGGKQRPKKGKKADSVAPVHAEPSAPPAKAKPAAKQAAEHDANGWETTGKATKAKGGSSTHSSVPDSHSRHVSQQPSVTAESVIHSIESQATAASGEDRRALWQAWMHQASSRGFCQYFNHSFRSEAPPHCKKSHRYGLTRWRRASVPAARSLSGATAVLERSSRYGGRSASRAALHLLGDSASELGLVQPRAGPPCEQGAGDNDRLVVQRRRNGAFVRGRLRSRGVQRLELNQRSPVDVQAQLSQDLGLLLDKVLPESRVEDGRAFVELLQQLTGEDSSTPEAPSPAPDLRYASRRDHQYDHSRFCARAGNLVRGSFLASAVAGALEDAVGAHWAPRSPSRAW